MAILQTSRLPKASFMGSLPEPANSDEAHPHLSSDQKIVAWLFRMTSAKADEHVEAHRAAAMAQHDKASTFERNRRFLIERAREPLDDWQTVANISGHTVQDFMSSGLELPISAAEIDHFRRNHRETDRLVGRDFLAARSDLPSPVAELYGLYRHRARLDTEATLFVAQATGSVRVARIMADLLAIGAFASGHECIAHLTATYSVPAAFDTSDLIDRTSDEAMRRLAMPIESPAHLLKMTPDEISVLANNIVERYALAPETFLEKANMLAEARQDVHRMPAYRRLPAALREGDLPTSHAWVKRLCEAYVRTFEAWLTDMPEVVAVVPELAKVSVFKDTY